MFPLYGFGVHVEYRRLGMVAGTIQAGRKQDKLTANRGRVLENRFILEMKQSA